MTFSPRRSLATRLGRGWECAWARNTSDRAGTQGATVGVFSAACCGGSHSGSRRNETVHALGIAGTQSAGLMAAQYGSMVKRMHAGRSAQSGLYAALLAEAGFTGIVNVFESEYGGFCTTFSRSHDRFNLAELTFGPGQALGDDDDFAASSTLAWAATTHDP